MYTIKSYQQLTPAAQAKFWRVMEQQSAADPSPAMVNMHSDKWRTASATLRYLLEVDNKFAQGDYFILYLGREPVASGGVHFSEWTRDIAMAGIRTWVHTLHRNKFLAAEYILPACKSWAIANACKIVTLTFNEYNRRLIHTWTRIRAGESADRIKNRRPDMMFYTGVKQVDKAVKINYTKQWVIYEQLAPMEFNWNEHLWRHKIKLDRKSVV